MQHFASNKRLKLTSPKLKPYQISQNPLMFQKSSLHSTRHGKRVAKPHPPTSKGPISLNNSSSAKKLQNVNSNRVLRPRNTTTNNSKDVSNLLDSLLSGTNISLNRSNTKPLKQLSSLSSHRSLLLGNLISPKRNVSTEKQLNSSQPKELREIFPISSATAILKFRHELTEGELSEILNYKTVYYLGELSKKLQISKRKPNQGYDDEEGNYQVNIGDHLAFRFEIVKLLGKGSFGQVYKCYDHMSKEYTAVKIIRNKPKFHQQGAVEIKILEHLRDCEPAKARHIVQLRESLVFRKHILLCFEMLSFSLYDLLKRRKFKGFPLSFVRKITYQVLSGLAYSAEQEVVHCDLKPENILLENPEQVNIKIIDYGSSCFVKERIYTYIQSRFYRAPEIFLGIPYTTSIDMWSLGCLLIELHTGYPLFPAESEDELFVYMVQILGAPPLHVLKQSTRKRTLINQVLRAYIEQVSYEPGEYPKKHALKEATGVSDPALLDFVVRCFEWDPQARMKPQEAFQHKFLQENQARQQRSMRRKRLSLEKTPTIELSNTLTTSKSIPKIKR